jgi:uncharacterized protein (TIGR03437 family)
MKGICEKSAIVVVLITRAVLGQQITTVAGTGQSGFSGDGGPATQARLNKPQKLAMDSAGNLYIMETEAPRIRKVTPAGIISTIAGTGQTGRDGDGGPATSAQLYVPQAIAADQAGNVYVAEGVSYGTGRIRKISLTGEITTVWGATEDGQLRKPDNCPPQSCFVDPKAIGVDRAGNLYVMMKLGTVMRMTPAGVISQINTGEGASETMAVDADGTLYVTNSLLNTVRMVPLAGESRVIAGAGQAGFSGDGGPATQAKLHGPYGIAVDGAGHVHLFDGENLRIRRISRDGIITTVAGTGRCVSGADNGDGGPASQAQICNALGMVTDSLGNLYFTDLDRVRKIAFATGQAPQIKPEGIANAASFQPAVAPGSLASIFGSNLAGTTGSASAAPLPTTIAGTSVTVNGRPAPLVYVSPTQINFQTPYEISPGTASVVVTAAGSSSPSATVTVSASAPGIFQWASRRAVAQLPDGSLVEPAKPAQPGSVIVVYLTGQGALDKPIASGAAAPANPLSQAALPVSATLGDKSADVLFAGLTPGFVGLLQVNLKVPAVGTGDHPLVITIGGVASNPALVAVSGN